jgi:hypothetical protein
MKLDYLIDTNLYDEGGYAQFYNIVGENHIGFKEFRNKRKAKDSYNRQKLLSKFDLAPRVVSNICRLNFIWDNDCPSMISGWGYVTEKALMPESGDNRPHSLGSIQKLVNNIYKKTKLKFWDCHYWNMGIVKRNGKKKLVCVDTGKESFDGYVNAWGFASPGPKCCYCNKYQCRCSEE